MSTLRLVAYNIGQGGSRDAALWSRVLPALAPDLYFVQETRDPRESWLGALAKSGEGSLLWERVPGGRWGSAIWAKAGARLTPLEVPSDFAGRVVAAVVEGCIWPGGVREVAAFSVHVPTREGSSYIKEMGRILDFATVLAGGLPLVLAGDFNVAVGLRSPDHLPVVTRGERDLLRRLDEELGMAPCWQTAHPGEPLARTLRWMRRLDSAPYHCDGLFIPAAWASALRDCTVPEDGRWCALSDHNPVIATLEV